MCLCGKGTETSAIIATYAGFVNSYYSNAPLENGEAPPADDRKYPGIMIGEDTAQPVLSLGKCHEGRRLVAGSRNGYASVLAVKLHHARPCSLLKLCSVAPLGEVLSVALSPKGQILATGGDKKVVELWPLSSLMGKGIGEGINPEPGIARRKWSSGQIKRAGILACTTGSWKAESERASSDASIEGSSKNLMKVPDSGRVAGAQKFACKNTIYGLALTAGSCYTCSAQRKDGALLLAVGTTDCTEVHTDPSLA